MAEFLGPPARISPTRAALILRVHPNTVRGWCRKALAGEPTEVKDVLFVRGSGYYWLSYDEIVALRAKRRSDFRTGRPSKSTE
jgi:hypothetical protein